MTNVLKKCKKELIYKAVSSIFVRGLVLIIPVYWSNTINHITDNIYDKAIKLVLITLLLTIIYYVWNYINQRSWYNFYNKLYNTMVAYKNKQKKNLKKYNRKIYIHRLI